MSMIMTGNGPRAAFASGLAAQAIPFDSIPVVDFSAMGSADPAARRAVGAAVRDACTRVGFFYCAGHGVDPGVIDRAFDAAHRFFDQPMAAKQAVSIDRSPMLRGYTALLAENTNPENKGDLHEGFDLALDLAQDDPDVRAGVFGYGPNQWPDDLPGFREALVDYHGAMLALGGRIFRAFALALDLEEDFFDTRITKPMAHMRVLHYPSQDGEIDETQIGIGAHSDYECFTILKTDDVPALQVLNAADEWIEAPPIPDTFIVNVGDLMARWTNDYFRSTIHRAINRSGRERYSIPFFFGPNSLERVEVLPSCRSEDHPARYEAIEAGRYIESRFDDTYAHRQAEDAPDEA
ncbi:MAG: 2-oxoglutarate and iron-dependent oxygenase domain-containing protein [Azospirillaceae bacterium]